jgi:chromosome transmission fidelity protein 4
MLGYIEITDQDTHHVVDIKMHDQSPSAARKGYNFTDTTKYDMASLGERGIAFACAPEAGHPAHVSFRPYASWETGTRAAEDEWVYELPPGVRILGLAAGGAAVPTGSGSRRKMTEDTQGRGHVVIATSENELTFLTGTGIERYSMGLDGDFVSMVAGSEWVFVVHRDGATTIDGKNRQNILFDVLLTLRCQVRKILKAQ